MHSKLDCVLLTALLYLSNWYQMDDGKDFEEEDVFGMDPQTAEQQEAVKKQLASKVGCKF